MSYAGKCSRRPVGAVNVSKVNLPFATSATNGTNDPNHTNASSPTLGSLVTWQDSLWNMIRKQSVYKVRVNSYT